MRLVAEYSVIVKAMITTVASAMIAALCFSIHSKGSDPKRISLSMSGSSFSTFAAGAVPELVIAALPGACKGDVCSPVASNKLATIKHMTPRGTAAPLTALSIPVTFRIRDSNGRSIERNTVT
jgi:hypothetical protein